MPLLRLGDAAGRATFCNAAWLAFTGATLEEERGSGWLRRVRESDRPGVLHGLELAATTAGPVRFEYHLRASDGSYRRVVEVCEPTPGGETLASTVTEAALPNGRSPAAPVPGEDDALRRILDSVATFVGVLDREGTVLEVNEAALRAGGLGRESIIGQKAWTTPWYTHDSYEAARLREAIDAARTGETVHYEAVLRMADDSRMPVALTLAPVFDGGGAVTRIIASGVDISGRVRAEQRHGEAEQHYRALFASLDEGICVFDMVRDERGDYVDYRFIETNAAFERHTGLINAAGRTARELVPNLDLSWVRAYGEVARTGQPRHLEQGEPSMGRAFDVFAMRLGGDGSDRVALLFRDITEQKRAERALRDNEANLQSMFQSAAVGIGLEEAETGRILDVNDCYCEITGYSRDELMGRPFLEWIHPDDRERDWAAFRTAAERGQGPYENVKRYVRKDGTIAWVSVTGNFIRDATGKALRSVVVVQDITERVRAEEALRESEDRFRIMADNISQLAWMADETGAITWYNKRWFEYTGTTEAEMLGWGWRALLHPDVQEPVEARFRQAVANGDQWEDTFPLRGRDGSYRWFLSRALPIRDASGRIVRWFGTNTDITALRGAEDALRESNARLQAERALLDAILEAAPVGIVVADAQGRLVRSNPANERLWGQAPRAESVDDYVLWRGWWADDSPRRGRPVEPQEWALARALRGEHSTGDLVEIEPFGQPGVRRTMLNSGAPVRDASGNIVGAVIAQMDITARTQAEAEVRRTTDLLTAVTGTTPDPVFATDLEGRLILANRATLSSFGREADQVLGHTEAECMGDSPHAAAAIANSRAVLETGETRIAEEVVAGPEGERIYLTSKAPLRDEHGAIIGLVAVRKDITDARRAQELIRESEERFRRTADAAPAMLWITDTDNNATFLSRSWHEFTGQTEEEAHGLGWLDAVHPEDRANTEWIFMEATTRREQFYLEYRLRTKDGRYRWALDTGRPYYDSEGNFLGYIGSVIDIDEVKEARELYHEQAELVRTIAENSTQGLVMMDANGYCIYANRAWLEMTGYDAEEIGSRQLHYLVHHHYPDGRPFPMEECPIDRALPENFSVTGVEELFFRKDGTSFPVIVAASPIRREGRPSGTVIEIRDITEAKRAENALRESEARFRHLADSMPQLVWSAMPDGSIDYYNRRVEEFEGIYCDRDGRWHWENSLHPADLERTVRAWDEAVANGSIFQVEHRVRLRDRGFRWHVSRAVPVRNTQGEITRWYGTATDIDELKRAEQDLIVNEEQLRKALAIKDEFLGLVSHELRTPLTPILGMANALQRPNISRDDITEAASVLKQSAERLHSLVENMLILARIDRDPSQDDAQEPVLVHHVAGAMVERHRERFPARPITLELASRETLVEGQHGWIEQVFENFLSNAEKYSPAGTPIVVEVAADDADVIVRVLDEGPGITKEQAKEVFEPFYRTQQAAAIAGGAGLGLAVCRRLVELQGGRIWAKPRPEKGAEFGFALPRLAVDD